MVACANFCTFVAEGALPPVELSTRRANGSTMPILKPQLNAKRPSAKMAKTPASTLVRLPIFGTEEPSVDGSPPAEGTALGDVRVRVCRARGS